MIEGVKVSTRRVISDPHGAVLHMLKPTDPDFAGFGEIYFSKIAVGQRKAWRRYHQATAQLVVPVGEVRFALYDERTSSLSAGSTGEFTLGESSYQLLTIPPQIWFAFQNMGAVDALIANCSSLAHDPTKIDRQDLDGSTIPYIWRD